MGQVQITPELQKLLESETGWTTGFTPQDYVETKWPDWFTHADRMRGFDGDWSDNRRQRADRRRADEYLARFPSKILAL